MKSNLLIAIIGGMIGGMFLLYLYSRKSSEQSDIYQIPYTVPNDEEIFSEEIPEWMVVM